MAKEILAHDQFPDLSQFADPEPLKCRDAQIPLRKDLDKVTRSFVVSLSPILAQRDLCMAFVKVTVHCGEREQSDSPESSGYWW